MLYSFVWKGKDKVKRAILIGPIEKGGLRMPDINSRSMIAAQRIICIKRYLAPNIASWKFFLDFYLKKVGGKFLFHCNFDYSKLSLNLPDFYKECILTWSSLNHNIPSSHAEISNHILWNNKLICINSCSVYNQKIIDTGLLTIRDLINYKCRSNGIWEPLQLLLSPIDHYLLYSLFSALPKEWRRVLKMNDTPSPSNEQFKDLTRFSLLLEGKETDVEKLQARSLYDHLISKMSAMPTAMKKYNETYNTENFQLDWEKIYSLSFQTTLDTKLREFQYKVLDRICYTNKMLFKFRIVDSGTAVLFL